MKRDEPVGHSVPLDQTVLAAAFGGDREAEREVLRCFRGSLHGDCAALQDALARRDPAAAARYAHRLKGGCHMVGALPLARVCERIEAAGRADDGRAAAAQGAALSRETERLTRFLAEMPT